MNDIMGDTNYSMIPNWLWDVVQRLIPLSEFAVVSLIYRRAFGYHSLEAEMSLSLIVEMTGLSLQGTVNAIKLGKEHGLIKKVGIGKNGASVYRVTPNLSDLHLPELADVNSVDGPISNELGETINSIETNYQLDREEVINPVETIKERLKENLKENLKEKDQEPFSDPAVAYKQRVEKALVKGMARSSQNGLDLSVYPEDVREVLAELYRLWKLKPPTIVKKRGGQYGLWVESARELIEACGEYPVTAILGQIYDDFRSYGERNEGTVPFRINGPFSLVRTAYGMAGQLRASGKGERGVVAVNNPEGKDIATLTRELEERYAEEDRLNNERYNAEHAHAQD